MGSLFEIAKSGIQAYRQALSVTGQNIANVNTEGYSKRDVALEEIGGIQGGVTDVSDQSGLGVRVDETREALTKMVGEQFDKNVNEHIWVNGIQGIDSILTMIMDRIDDGDTDGAKDDIRQLQDELLNNNVRG